MNVNEECLLKFLGQPGRLDKTTAELKRFIFSINDNIISKKDKEEFDFSGCQTSPLKSHFKKIRSE